MRSASRAARFSRSISWLSQGGVLDGCIRIGAKSSAQLHAKMLFPRSCNPCGEKDIGIGLQRAIISRTFLSSATKRSSRGEQSVSERRHFGNPSASKSRTT